MGRCRRVGFDGVKLFCSVGVDIASFYERDHRSCTVCSGVRDVELRDVRNYIPFAHMAIMCYHERGFKDFFRPLRQFLLTDLHL
jgi:hypothetical protein